MSSGFGQSGKPFNQKLFDNISSQVSPIFSSKPLAKYNTGARAILKINNQLIGFAFSISWRINTQYDELFTIDDYMPHELVPNKVTVEGTLGTFHIPGKGASAEMQQSNVLSFLTHRYISIEVRDSQTNDLLFQTNKAMIVSRAEDIKADDIGRVSLHWKAIGWQDEKLPANQKKPGQTTSPTRERQIDGQRYLGDFPASIGGRPQFGTGTGNRA
jgi:hypothetical protein